MDTPIMQQQQRKEDQHLISSKIIYVQAYFKDYIKSLNIYTYIRKYDNDINSYLQSKVKLLPNK